MVVELFGHQKNKKTYTLYLTNPVLNFKMEHRRHVTAGGVIHIFKDRFLYLLFTKEIINKQILIVFLNPFILCLKFCNLHFYFAI